MPMYGAKSSPWEDLCTGLSSVACVFICTGSGFSRSSDPAGRDGRVAMRSALSMMGLAMMSLYAVVSDVHDNLDGCHG
jgi:hypothetical protein